MSAAASGTHTVQQQAHSSQGYLDEGASTVTEALTLRLVPRRKKKKAVKWSEEVIDNEFLGKKSSKKCCIFHKKREFGDWSDDDDEGCDKDCGPCNDGSLDGAGARPAQLAA